MKHSIFLSILLFSSCEILEIPRVPLLAPPLGLAVFKAGTGTAADPFRMAIRYEAYNTEAFFSGWRIYIATTRADLERVDPNDPRFALAPTGTAVLLSNFNVPNDTNTTVSFAGAMTAPSQRFYPQSAGITSGSLIVGGLGSTITEQAGITPFVASNTTTPPTVYYIGVYAYSIGDNVYSLPSITNFTFP